MESSVVGSGRLLKLYTEAVAVLFDMYNKVFSTSFANLIYDLVFNNFLSE